MTIAKVGEVYALQLHDGRWGACQVTWAERTQVELLALDWIGTTRPGLDELAEVGTLMIEAEGEQAPCRINVSPVPPWSAKLIGSARLLASFDERCTVWSGWGYISHQILAQWRWANEVPAEVKEARRRLQERAGVQVELELQGTTRKLDSTTWRLWLGPENLPVVGLGHYLRIDPNDPVPWHRLEPLELVSEVQYEGQDPNFISFLESRPFIRRVLWRGHGQKKIDLSNTWVRTLSLEVGAKDVDVALSPRVESLHLIGEAQGGRLSVTDSRDGWGVRLFASSAELPDPVDGLAALRHFNVYGLKKADVRKLTDYPALQSVMLQGGPGELAEAGAFAGLEDLRELVLRDFPTLAASDLPDRELLPKLDTFECYGVSAKEAASLEARFDGLRRLSVRPAKVK